MSGPQQPVVQLSAGSVIGSRAGAVNVFRGIPYAASPVGRLRLALPEAHANWSGVRDCRVAGPAAPQPESRLAGVMGAAPDGYSELDCLTLNVFAPDAPGPHPVLFWLHGGGFSSGSGGWPWYDGTRFAQRHGIVVVTANYRLGALGFLHLADLGGEADNLGVHDQIAALEWVAREIGAFGGDAARITVGGQSAGALSAGALASSSRTASLVNGLVMQSPPASTMIQSRSVATDRARTLLDRLGVDLSDPLPALRALRTEAFVTTSVQMARDLSSFGDFDPVFAPVEDVGIGLLSRVGGALARSDVNGPLLIGNTSAETAAFLCQRPGWEQLSTQEMSQWFDRVLGEAGPDTMAGYQQRNPRQSAADVLIAASTDRSFAVETALTAAAHSSRGAASWVYQFDWEPGDTSFGACHCLELPFLFDTFESFIGAPMLGRVSASRQVVEAFQGAVAGLVRGGSPAVSSVADWPGYDRRAYVLHLAEEPAVRARPADDLLGVWA